MAFRFDFAGEDLDDELEAGNALASVSPAEDTNLASMTASGADVTVAADDYAEIPLSELIDALPPLISYTPIRIPATHSEGTPIILPRRDLFDVRFQLLNEDVDPEDGDEKEGAEAELAFVDAPSDLVPGVYEGGLKTWECSVDLAAYLARLSGVGEGGGFDVRGKRIIEIGCGTAIPSLYLLHQAFESLQASASQETVFCLQDFNRSALELMTFPNIILTWYLSSAATSYRDEERLRNPPPPPTTAPISDTIPEGDEDADEADSDPEDSSAPAVPELKQSDFEVELTPELLAAFTASLSERRISLRFYSGSWEALAASPLSVLAPSSGSPVKLDVVLTSETIYRTESLPALLNVLHRASTSISTSGSGSAALCLVAAKVVYFGVGGGTSEFVRALEAADTSSPASSAAHGHSRGKGRAEVVWEETKGVARRIMQVRWD